MAKRRRSTRESKTTEEPAPKVKEEVGDNEDDEFVDDDTSIQADDSNINDDGDDDNDNVAQDQVDSKIGHKTKKRKTVTLRDDDEEEVDDVNGEEQEVGEDDREEDEDVDEDEENDEDEDGEDEEQAPQEVPRVGKLWRRGRKKKEKEYMFNTDDVFDADGNPISVENDEVRIPNEDPKGKEKIDELGYLKGGREFKMDTFKILGEGDRLYMISTGPARMVGFRDSYLLFKTHKTLFKRVCDHDQKMDLIQRGIIPNSYKGRAVNLVSARSIFREFGARMIKEGKKVIDDFWEQKALENGDIPGEYADPEEIYKNKLSNLLGDGGSGVASGGNATPMAPVPIVNYQTDETWLYQIASQTSDYNHKLAELRAQVTSSGLRDVFTNTVQFPTNTQPNHLSVCKIDDKQKLNSKLTRDIYIDSGDLRRPVTGLASIPQEIIDEIKDEEIKKAILEQQDYERKVTVQT